MILVSLRPMNLASISWGRGLLVGSDPRTRVALFFLLAATVMGRPFWGWGWLLAALMTVLGVVAARDGHAGLVRAWWRLRWLLVAMVLVHALFTPGQALLPGLPWPSREGLMEGGVQALRLTLLVMLAWVLLRTTPPGLLLGACDRLLTPWHRFGARRGVAMLGYVANQIPHLFRKAAAVREALALRLPPPVSFRQRLERLALAGEVLLFRLLWEVRRQHEALRLRGFGEHELPLPRPPLPGFGWRDHLLLLWAASAFFLPFG